MSKLDKGQNKSRQFIMLLKFLSNLPGLGFLAPYADKLHQSQEKVQVMRGNIAMKMDDVEDARDAWDNFSEKK